MEGRMIMNTDNDERWLIDGDCNKCRRAEYCSKPCTANKRRTTNWLHDEILSTTGLGIIYNELERLHTKSMTQYDDRQKAKQFERNNRQNGRKGRTKTC